MGWQDTMEPWEVLIIQEKKLESVAAAASWSQRKRMAMQLFLSAEARRLKKEGKVSEAQCRRADCMMQCRTYLGLECNRQGGRKVPLINGKMEVVEKGLKIRLQPAMERRAR